MKYLFEILGDNEALGKAEISGVVDAYQDKHEVLEDEDGIFAVDTSLLLETLKKRLGLTRCISKHLISGDYGALTDFFEHYRLDAESFCVRIKRIKKHQPAISTRKLKDAIGGILSKTSNVDLEKPGVEIRVIVSEKCHAGLKLEEMDRKSFEKRKVQYRPFFSPISLHPKLARALINLSRIKEGELLLDPFCGTGGVLMEAGLIGVKIMGSDISSKMVQGCRDNLRSIGLKGKFFKADVSEVPKILTSVDAIATDPPYGRSASTKGEDISSLYKRTFEDFKRVLNKGRYLAIVLPKREHVELGAQYFELKEMYEVRVHKSLTRFFTVFKN